VNKGLNKETKRLRTSKQTNADFKCILAGALLKDTNNDNTKVVAGVMAVFIIISVILVIVVIFLW
jgi:hypothetical protein